MFLILLGLLNYIVKALLLQQVNVGTLHCGSGSGGGLFNGVMLPPAGIGGSNMQTQILTHEATLECCDSFGVYFWTGLTILHIQYSVTTTYKKHALVE